MLEFEFNKKNTLLKFNFKEFLSDDFQKGEFEKAFKKGKQRAAMRMQIYLKQYGKIDDSEMCPCASGRTYAECCKIKLS